jgi:rubrerythrin
MTETTVLENARNIFIEMKEQRQTFEPAQEQTELYRKAREIEKKSQQFYQEKAGQTDKDDQKKLFERLTEEEQKHYFLLENIIEFVSRPKLWLENAEWYHLEEY